MRRVLVTGGVGMIGSAVVRRLLNDSELEVRVSDEREAPSWMTSACEVQTTDLRVLDNARAAVAGCDRVVHLAAIVGGIGNFHKLPYTLSEVNAGLYNAMFRAAIDADIDRFVYVSSSMVFERASEFPTTEDHLDHCLPPQSAYGFSKLTGEIFTLAAHAEFGLPFTICRPFNAYGPGEMPEDDPGIAHVVPDLIKKVLAGQQPLQIFGSGEHTRTLTHVDDVADGIVTAMLHANGLNQAFNVSASEELTVTEIAKVVWDVCGKPCEGFSLEHLPSYPVDVVRRWPSVEKARRLLGWEARVGLREGVAATADWLASQLRP